MAIGVDLDLQRRLPCLEHRDFIDHVVLAFDPESPGKHVEAQISEKSDKTNCRAECEEDRRALDAGWHGGRCRLECGYCTRLSRIRLKDWFPNWKPRRK